MAMAAFLICNVSFSVAQGDATPTVTGIKIGGNVYGGGNAGNMTGNTSVTVLAGNLEGSVFGGARQANVGGHAFVNIDGAHISGDITINRVYGGNDISGEVGTDVKASDALPTELTTPAAGKTTPRVAEYGLTDATGDAAGKNKKQYDAFILTTPERQADAGETQSHIFIGQLFGGGNGAYDYTTENLIVSEAVTDPETGEVTTPATTTPNPYHGKTLPQIDKTYLELRGGTFGYVFAGGNNATVKEATDICIDDSSTPMERNSHLTLPESVDLTHLYSVGNDIGELDKPGNQRLMDMGLNFTTFRRGYNFQRVFGGNNVATMHIHPTWHLEDGKIVNLYNGGNEGDMTSPEGLLLEIGKRGPNYSANPLDIIASDIEIVNVFGGCRKANVIPLDDNGEELEEVLSPSGYNFPSNLAARVLIRSGNIENVYGGNDITGSVWGGTAVGIYTSINGNVYGGGNGSYAYTDTPEFKNDVIWGDYYYNPSEILGQEISSGDNGLKSAEALNLFRPNAEQVSIRIWGPDEAHPTIVKGSIYLGGNSASLRKSSRTNQMVELKIGSHAIAENVFLGNNGANMVDPTMGGVLWQYAQKGNMHYQVGSSASDETVSFSTMDLTDQNVFAKYMEGCAMPLVPSVVFDDQALIGDPDTYTPYSSHIGSFYCGGNVGSMNIEGVEDIDFNHEVIIYDKLVGGCNNANVPSQKAIDSSGNETETELNAPYEGGLLGSADATSGNKLVLNLAGLEIQPKRWNDAKDALVWNVVDGTGANATVPDVLPDEGHPTADDKARRLKGGNVYGGCYESGHVNGNVVINIDATLMDRDKLFDELEYEDGEPKLYNENYKITKRRTGVILDEQGMDVFGSALNIFGAGYGQESEIWGSTTINLNKGYVFQIFGGGEKGAVGHGTRNAETKSLEYTYGEPYSTYINLKGDIEGAARLSDGDSPDMAEAEFIYGGGFEGIIAGNTHINLGNGRIFNSFAGSCNADILGHTETYVGRNTNGNDTDLGFPWIRDHIYGGNDLGGRILGEGTLDVASDEAKAGCDFSARVGSDASGKLYNSTVTTASAYTEYIQGHVENIFGGCYGDYVYDDAAYTARVKHKPYLHNAFVNIRPVNNEQNAIAKVFGSGQGAKGERAGDESQDRSYVLVDIPQSYTNYTNMEVYGAGAYDGLGMRYKKDAREADGFDPDNFTAVVDLVRGNISAAYGGSKAQGFTRRTMVNVPTGSTIEVGNIFGGAFGEDPLIPCDVYESHVNYHSADATVTGAVYGGNNFADRTLYTQVNIHAPVWSNKAKGYQGTVFGAGKGAETWAQYTEVNLEPGAMVYEVYGGGNAGRVINLPTLRKWEDEEYNAATGTSALDLSMGDYEELGLDEPTLVHASALGGNEKYNTNVHINEGATVTGYAYGGGLGKDAVISGTTYIDLLGGTVVKDVYAAGTSGDVKDKRGVKSTGFYSRLLGKKIDGFTASSTVYVQGGTARNVYGGGWEGSVGRHDNYIDNSGASPVEIADAVSERVDPEDDILGETRVIIGREGGTTLTDGDPAILRNVYGGGEGGSVYGTAFITMNNGHIGYRFVEAGGSSGGAYEEVVDDAAPGDNQLDMAGNIFGGGYVANSFTDHSNITMYGGTVRGSVYGGGEIGPIGRGTALAEKQTGKPSWAFANNDATIYKGGSTHIEMYGGHVVRNVFGGGRGYDNWGGDGTKFMSDEVVATLDKSIKGYVFGSTEVRIRGGEVGTAYNVANGGYGNVFGGGDVGYVYSATGKKQGTRGSQAISGLTNGLPTDGGGYYYSKWIGDSEVGEDHTKCELSHDCQVVVEPYCKVKAGQTITIDNAYAEGEYVPIEELNKLSDKNTDAARWAAIDYESGVTIHNAVFAGGNVTIGSDQLYVNTGTVFGNASAALRDAYNRDLITIGTEHTGGIYGDGNLTMVDGWREIHIDNYGTDYYSQDQEVTKEVYNTMSDRERAYFVLNYKCLQEDVTDKNGVKVGVGKRMTSDEFKEAFAYEDYTNIEDNPFYQYGIILADGTPNPTYFEELGFCSIYAGRLLNTIQRCDMAAVFGSRIVLQGARDRVPEKADFTRYTLNRVGELSLNQQKASTAQAGDNQKHGNYFGIYSVVNYLGNLTSDVLFTQEKYTGDYTSVRTTSSDREENAADGSTTYYDWKLNHAGKANRNNATSPNKVALSSGVYLEIIREESEKQDETEWGLITGVVELDLIDVKTGLGGGYVYARNQHGTKTWHQNWSKVNLSPYNLTARTYKRFTYYDETENSLQTIETSGNFVHNTKQIIDDCYPNANAYHGADKSAAHYWYIKGSIYVYDQYISAYTGSASAYAQTVSIPLTISASSHGKLTLRDVQQNLYAYYGDDYVNGTRQPLGTGSVIVNGITYKAGDPIDYWAYQSLTPADQQHFVPKVYTTIAECTINGTTYPEGTAFLPDEYTSLQTSVPTIAHPDDSSQPVGQYVYDVEHGEYVALDYIVREANVIGHDQGFILTYDMNNPGLWNDYYTKKADNTEKITSEDYNGKNNDGTYKYDRSLYYESPTYTPMTSGVYGQKDYNYGDIVSRDVYQNYENNVKIHKYDSEGHLNDDQATTEPAYVMTATQTVTNKAGTTQQLGKGTPVYESDYEAATWATLSKEEAKVCTSTLQVSESEYIYVGQLLSATDYAALDDKTSANLTNYFDDAYYITKSGKYGGAYYTTNQAYRALEAWCDLSADDRENFKFNYDALDLLIDPTYGTYGNSVGYKGGDYGFKPQYDGYEPGTKQSQIDNDLATAQHTGCTPLKPNIYSSTQPIDYEAEFNPSSTHFSELGSHYDSGTGKLTYTDENDHTVTISTGYDNRIKRPAFEDIPNERAHWSPVIVTAPGTYYVVKAAFIRGDLPYTVGQQIDETLYNSLTDDQKQNNIRLVNISEDYTEKDGNDKYIQKYYYYCRESYKVNEKGEGVGFTDLTNDTPYATGDIVPQDIIIKEETYKSLPNLQTGFIIHGTAPIETATFYVAREPDIYDLSKEKIITVVYLYEYEESDESGNNITPVSERHIVNIHLNFESGIPEIGPLTPPDVVLPGSTVGLNIPAITPGAFEITSSGWEIFPTEGDADLHKNGQAYENNSTPMYWYQNNYYVAYYAQTYLGKTYSNAVPFSVANYHDLKKVMEAKTHHYYIDHPDVDRASKVYINDYSHDATGETNGLTLLRQLYDLSVLEPANLDADGLIASGDFTGHAPLNSRVKGGANLEFILRANQSAPASVPGGSAAWTPIGDATQCFEGNFHGDGYTVSGLDNSLFGRLCGNVYNTGVTGTFTSSGIADSGDGFVENCWVKTTGTPAAGVKAVFGGDGTNDSGTQLVNSYYTASSHYAATSDVRGNATEMPDAAFFNGTVAYNLNGFYLGKRYYDHTVFAGSTSEKAEYTYLRANATDGTLEPQTSYYPAAQAYYGPADGKRGYVEERYAYPDFIYAGGTIPEEADVRQLAGGGSYAPLWPDDYLFFGQKLTYGYNAQQPHEPLPAHNVKGSTGRMPTDDTSNRVLRAPAYYRSSTMGMAHFNPWANLAGHVATAYTVPSGFASTDCTAYPGMTAIDFTGHNDATYAYEQGWAKWSQTSQQPQSSSDMSDKAYAFYPPLLDLGDGLSGIANRDLTKNLLIYIPEATTATEAPAKFRTRTVVNSYATDPAYADFYDDADAYRRVLENKTAVNTHVVELAAAMSGGSSAAYQSQYDHFLVDRQDFNAPMKYTFLSGKRMWYQRKPDTYVSTTFSGTPAERTTQGWEGISLPFEAELVSTQQKGEITHFYSGSYESKNTTGTKIGHEYWLRQFTGEATTDGTTVKATMDYPSATAAAQSKAYTNTFLWDYYYSHNSYNDLNGDDYQEDDGQHTYYSSTRVHERYARLQAATPYIIGLPGTSYYEFDLSGNFVAQHTATPRPAKLDKQVISFVSEPGITIGVSDQECVRTSGDYGYTFRPSYLNWQYESDGSVPTGFAGGTDSYALNAAGTAYDQLTAADPADDDAVAAKAGTAIAQAFRPYFTGRASSPSRQTRSIVFAQSADDDEQPMETHLPGYLTARAGKHKIIVSSLVEEAATVRIVAPSGLCVATFTLQPGESRETHIVNAGVYIVQSTDGRLTKKLMVK